MAERNKKAKKSGMQGDLDTFFQSKLAVNAAAGLSDRAVIAIHIDGQDFFFQKNNGKNALHPNITAQPDVHFWLSESTMRHVFDAADKPRAGIGSIGIAIFEKILTKDEGDKIKFRVDANFLTLWTKGYFSVLKAGGADVTAFLSKLGFSMAKIKEVLLKNFRG